MERRRFGIQDWMITAIIAILGCAVVFGAMRTTVEDHEVRITKVETWKDAAISQMGNMDGKLDALLQANGVTYQPKK